MCIRDSSNCGDADVNSVETTEVDEANFPEGLTVCQDGFIVNNDGVIIFNPAGTNGIVDPEENVFVDPGNVSMELVLPGADDGDGN